MMLSTGTFHQRFVSVDRIVFAARAAASASIRLRIAVEVCDQQTFDEKVLYRELAREIAARSVFIGHDPWTTDAGGRGTTAVSHERLFDDGGAELSLGGCGQILDTITVTPDQQLLACCGFPMEQLPLLRIGSVERDALDDRLRNAPSSLLKMWLHVAGPHGIADFIAQHEPGYVLPPSPSICQACVTLQRDTRAMAVIAEHESEIAQAVLANFIELNGGIEPLRAF